MNAQLSYLKNSVENISSHWQSVLSSLCYEDLIAIDKKLNEISLSNIIYPDRELIFRALSFKNPNQIKVVILGQDPYHGFNEANGLAFAVNHNIKVPPSLRNIYKELLSEYANLKSVNLNPTLLELANQGVLLLNSTLTVIKDQPNSMVNIGWQVITDKLISYLSDSFDNLVFMLWGSFAQKKLTLINQSKHLVLTTTHPSPLSAYRGFLGCNHFRSANEYLLKYNKEPIEWLS